MDYLLKRFTRSFLLACVLGLILFTQKHLTSPPVLCVCVFLDLTILKRPALWIGLLFCRKLSWHRRLSKVILKTTYPGQNAETQEVMALAEAYCAAAMALLKKAPVNVELSYAPARMCSIHSIELYLNAFLHKEGFATHNALLYLG